MEQEELSKRLTRSDIQAQAKIAAIEALTNIGKATVKIGTGVGKGLLMLQIIDHFKPEKVTWLIDSTDGRDINDSAEFYKHGYEHLLPLVEFSCYQSAYKWKDKDLGFLVCNEADYMATEEYSKAVSENRYSMILMATATIAESKQWFFDKYAPVCFVFTTQQAEDAGVINKTIYKFVNYNLSTEKTIVKKGKYGEYKTSEEAEYVYWDNQFISTTITVEAKKKAVKEHYEEIQREKDNPEYKATKKIPNFNYQSFKNEISKLYQRLKFIGSQRSNILYKSQTTAEVAKKVIRHILNENQNNKIVAVAKFTEHIDSICEHTWHSKNEGTKKEPSLVKDWFNQGVIRLMGVVNKINRGANLVGANHFLWVTYDGSDTTGQQQNGRSKRLDIDDTATIWILVPYFYKNSKRLPTRAYSFANKRLADFELTEKNVFNLNINEL